ncbi:diheme cytochrome c-553 [Flavihumibacter petaseus]|nr:diheme cytochrome c-553 [Flavihumibacter petaseus]
MKKTFLSAIGLAALLAAAIVSCQQKPTAAAETGTVAAPTRVELAKRGEHLVNVLGCDDCHSTKTFGPGGPEIDTAHRLAGHLSGAPLPVADTGALKKGWVLFAPDLTAAVGPWGTSYSANLTSDETGIGNWSEAQFIKAIREGKLKGMDNSRPLLPPMPWFNYARLEDNDLKAIYYFLQSTKPVHNVVPPPQPPVSL